MANKYLAYYRVSTIRQGHSGLGLEAQKKSAQQYLSSCGGELLGEFTEIESGKKSDRPMLTAALEACKQENAILLIAKLDRLARNVHFISGLLEADVRFVAADMPNADRFMLHVYAAMAEEEARRISIRTKQALRAAKARGVVLGKNGRKLAQENAAAADRFCLQIGKKIDDLREREKMTFREIADHLNKIGVETANRRRWHCSTVYNAHNRYTSLSKTLSA